MNNRIFRQCGLAGLCLTLAHLSHAQQQVADPVRWNFQVTTSGDTGFDLRITATINSGWHIYAQEQPKEAVSEPTKITFQANPMIDFKGALKERGKREVYQDTLAGIVQYQYADSVVYTRKAILRARVKTNVTGSVTYQACTGEMCLPPKTIPFSIPLP